MYFVQLNIHSLTKKYITIFYNNLNVGFSYNDPIVTPEFVKVIRNEEKYLKNKDEFTSIRPVKHKR